MEPVFVAEYIVTPGLFQETYCRIRRISMVIFGIASVAFLGQLLFGVAQAVFMLTIDVDILGEYYTSLSMPLILASLILRPLVPFLLSAFLALRPLYHAKKVWASTAKHDRFTATFYEDHMDVYRYSDGSTNHFKYEYIRKIVCSRNYVIIRTNSHMLRSIPKTSLTKGSPEKLEAFLRDKAKEAKHRPQQTRNS